MVGFHERPLLRAPCEAVGPDTAIRSVDAGAMRRASMSEGAPDGSRADVCAAGGTGRGDVASGPVVPTASRGGAVRDDLGVAATSRPDAIRTGLAGDAALRSVRSSGSFCSLCSGAVRSGFLAITALCLDTVLPGAVTTPVPRAAQMRNSCARWAAVRLVCAARP
jgi:hypothetical protein